MEDAPSPASARRARLCTAGGCVSIGASRHSRLGVPVCHEHARSYLDMGKRGWPLEAESGDHVTCQWCCGVVVENDAVVEHEESVFLCDGCNTAWCHSCLGANVGAGYVQQVAGAPDDVQWRCLYVTTRCGRRSPPARARRRPTTAARVVRRGGRTAAGAARSAPSATTATAEANREGGAVVRRRRRARGPPRARGRRRPGRRRRTSRFTDDGDFEEDVLAYFYVRAGGDGERQQEGRRRRRRRRAAPRRRRRPPPRRRARRSRPPRGRASSR